MASLSWFRAILSGLVGLVIGVIFVAVANLLSPVANLVQTLVVVCVPAFLSSLLGYVIGIRQKKQA
jgi:hypothetical protein